MIGCQLLYFLHHFAFTIDLQVCHVVETAVQRIVVLAPLVNVGVTGAMETVPGMVGNVATEK